MLSGTGPDSGELSGERASPDVHEDWCDRGPVKRDASVKPCKSGKVRDIVM